MKKFIAMLLALVMVFAMAACGGENNTTGSTQGTQGTTQSTQGTTQGTESTGGDNFDPLAKDEGTMTYAEYAAAELDSEVVVECFVQATQGWWNNNGQGVITVYAQDPDGAYFMYNMNCAEEDASKLVPGTKIKVTGYKAAYKGEVEIIDCTFEILEGSWIAPATDVTDKLSSSDLINYQNMFVAINGATVAPSYDGDGNEVAFLYKWNGSGTAGDDLYFNVNVGGKIYNMCVESYLTGDGTAVYDAVETLKVGDFIDMEGFLYWYDGVNPHITGVEIKGNAMDKAAGTMTHAEYIAAELDTEVVVECFVQATQGWWNNNGQGVITVYAQDPDGAYFMYNMNCAEEDAAKLVPGTKIRVTGYKAAYKGEVEIIDCSFEILEGSWIAPATDVTELLGSEDLINYQNMFASIKNATVVASYDGDGNEVAFLYKWNGSGTAGDDLYFNIEVNGVVYNMCVESYLTGDGTAVYDAVEALTIGAVINLEGFLYWYDGVNPHITFVEVIG